MTNRFDRDVITLIADKAIEDYKDKIDTYRSNLINMLVEESAHKSYGVIEMDARFYLEEVTKNDC